MCSVYGAAAACVCTYVPPSMPTAPRNVTFHHQQCRQPALLGPGVLISTSILNQSIQNYTVQE